MPHNINDSLVNTGERLDELEAEVEFLLGVVHRHHVLIDELLGVVFQSERKQFGDDGYHSRYLRGQFVIGPEAEHDASIGWNPPAHVAARR